MNTTLNASMDELATLLGMTAFPHQQWPVSLTIDKKIAVHINPLSDEQLVLFCSAGTLPDERSIRVLMRDNLFSTDALRPRLCLTNDKLTDDEKLMVWIQLPAQSISGQQIYQALMRLIKSAQGWQIWLADASTTPNDTTHPPGFNVIQV